jgi:hypothetical protein
MKYESYHDRSSQYGAQTQPITLRKPLDIRKSDRKVWLVKVPKWIASNWRNAKEADELGRMTLTTS